VRTSKSSESIEDSNAAETTQSTQHRTFSCNTKWYSHRQHTRSAFLTKIRLQGLEFPAYVLAALTAAGGAIGYVRTKSKPSVIAGTAVGLLCKSPELGFPQPLIAAPR